MLPDRDSRSRVDLDVSLGQEPRPAAPRRDTPFNIAVLGNFRSSAESADGAPFQPLRVDRDNVNEVLASLAPTLRFRTRSAEAADEADFAVRFAELDDFHPDRLLQRVKALAAAWQLRKRLADPRTFAEAARELSGESTSAQPVPGVSAAASGASLLEDILAEVPGPALAPVTPREDELQAFVRRAVAPHLVPGQDPRQPALLAQMDDVLTATLRSLLHQPAFQSLEALWRGLDFLTRRLDTGSSLRVYLVNASHATLAADLGAGHEDARFSRFVSGGVDGERWAVLAGCYTFGPGAEDAALLADIARVARTNAVPFMAAADARLAGCPMLEDFTETASWTEPIDPAWDAFRRSNDAHYIALTLPRILLRLPYGENGEPCDLLPFEEVGETYTHEDFLWGNPVFASALLLGRSFLQAGWRLRPGQDQDIDGLPLHTVRRAGATDLLPCAESLMTERAAARLIEHGLSPLATLKQQGAVRLVRFQSLAAPASVLAGGWSQSA